MLWRFCICTRCLVNPTSPERGLRGYHMCTCLQTLQYLCTFQLFIEATKGFGHNNMNSACYWLGEEWMQSRAKHPLLVAITFPMSAWLIGMRIY